MWFVNLLWDALFLDEVMRAISRLCLSQEVVVEVTDAANADGYLLQCAQPDLALIALLRDIHKGTWLFSDISSKRYRTLLKALAQVKPPLSVF